MQGKKKLIIKLNHKFHNEKFQIITKYEEIIDILKFLNNKNKDIFSFLYNYKENVHSLLYKYDEIINLDFFEINKHKNLAPYFYLSMLLKDNSEIINYSYSLQFIKDLNELISDLEDSKKLSKIILSKVLLELISNYKGLDNYEEENEKEIIDNISNNGIQIIKENSNILNDLNLSLDDMIGKKIDKIYSKIINELIRIKEFKNLEYIETILSQLDLEEINITKFIYEDLILCLESKNDFISNYKIEKIEDILNEKKINFYYILLKYILKNTIYIYNIPILLKAKKFFLNHIKENDLIYADIDKGLQLKLQYIIINLLDSKYYNLENNTMPKYDLLKLKDVLKYYKEFLFESKSNEINDIEDIINNKKHVPKEYLDDYESSQKMIFRIPLINYFYFEKSQKKEKISEVEFSEYVKNWETIEDMIKSKKIKKMQKIVKTILFKYFVDDNNKKIIMAIFKQDQIDYFINENKKLLEKIKNKNEDIKEKEKEKGEAKIIKEKKDNPNFNNKKEKKSDIIENKLPIYKINNNNLFNSNINDLTKDKSTYSKANNENNILKSKNKNDLSNFIPNQINYNDNSSKCIIINKEDSLKDKSTKLTYNYNIQNNNNNKDIDKNNGDMFPSPLPQKKVTDNDIINKILNKSSFKFQVDENKHISIYEILYGDSNTKISPNLFNTNFGKYINSNSEEELEKNAGKFNSFIKEFCERLIIEFKNNFKFNIDLNFQNEGESKNSDNIFNISCKYIFYEPYSNNPISFIDYNILINGTYSNSNGFEFLIIEINNDKYKDIKEKVKDINKDSKNSIKKSTENNSNKGNNDNYKINSNPQNEIETLIKKTLIKDSFIVLNDLNSVTDEVKILDVIKIVEQENKYNGFVQELERGYYIICKSDNSLNLYDIYFNQILNIKGFNQPIFNVYERINEDKMKDKDNIYIIVCTYDDINLIIIDLNTFNYTIKAYPTKNQNYLNYIEMKKTNCIALGFNGVTNYLNLFNDNNNILENRLFDESYFSCFKINDNIIALASNSIMPGGQDQLIFYNVKSKKISNTINNYSFIMSPNGFSLIERKEENKKKVKIKKILICACKKYYSYQKNGILLINVDFSDSKYIKEPFFNMDDIEIYCICPIKIVENNNENKNYDKIDENYKKNIIIKDTDYFLVGGFDTEKRSGVIKLYKLILSDEVIETKIEFIQDIEFIEDVKKNFEGFYSPINSILQSKISGNIIISSYDGKIYLLTKVNLDYYLNTNKKI